MFKKDKKDKSKGGLGSIFQLTTPSQDETKKSSDILLGDWSEKTQFAKGQNTIKDLLAPSFIDRSDPSFLKINNKYTKMFAMEGFPSYVYMTWLDKLYNYDGDMDVTLRIEPFDDRVALDEISRQITKIEAQLIIEQKSGDNRNITRLTMAAQKLYEQRIALEQNLESLFHVQIINALNCESKEELIKKSQLLDNDLKGSKIKLAELYLKQDEAFLSNLPIGRVYIDDWFRNFNSKSLSVCNPFYNSEICHENGVFLGINSETATAMDIDFYDRSKLNNSNITIIGESGSGKTFTVSILTLRSILKGIHTVIIDPEGEYKKLTKAVGGAYIELSQDDDTVRINPFELEEEDVVDDDGTATGDKYVAIKDKISDIINLLAVMAGGLTKEQEGLLSTILSEVYQQDFRFNEKPESLYEKKDYFDEEKEILVHGMVKRTMPTFSDFYAKLEQYSKRDGLSILQPLVNAFLMYKKGGVFDMFDCQSNINLDFKNIPLVVFGVKNLEEGILRPIGMYIAMTYTWEKFVKKNPETKKRVIADEAWMLFNPSMKGSEYTSAFMEKAARRIRKRNAGLLVASQNFKEFQQSLQGQAVLTNAKVNIFLKQSPTDIDALQEVFKLSQGEKQALLSASRGEFLIKMDKESSFGYVLAFEYEKALIENKNLKS